MSKSPDAYYAHYGHAAHPHYPQYYPPVTAGAAQPPYPSGFVAYPAAPYSPYASHPVHSGHSDAPFIDFSNGRFVKGLLIGAAAAYVITNENVQRNAIKGAVKVWTMLQGSVEELKERFQDAEAEIRAAEQGE